jgi:hypothetical protein
MKPYRELPHTILLNISTNIRLPYPLSLAHIWLIVVLLIQHIHAIHKGITVAVIADLSKLRFHSAHIRSKELDRFIFVGFASISHQ